MKALFGTDGIRGEAGVFPLDRATAKQIGFSLAHHLRSLGEEMASLSLVETRASLGSGLNKR